MNCSLLKSKTDTNFFKWKAGWSQQTPKYTMIQKKKFQNPHKKIPQETNLLDKNESRGLQESGSVWSKTTSLKKQNIMHISRI